MNASRLLVVAALAVTLLAVAPAGSLAAGTGVGADPYAAYLAPATACPGQLRADASAKIQARAMLCLVNWARRHDRLPRLRASNLLDRSSQIKARDIIRCQDFSHTPCGQSFEASFQRVGYMKRASYVGENIYWSTLHAASPRSAFNAWLHSDGHRRNLLSRSWRELGIGRLRANDVFGYGGGVVWVNQFGRRVG